MIQNWKKKENLNPLTFLSPNKAPVSFRIDSYSKNKLCSLFLLILHFLIKKVLERHF